MQPIYRISCRSCGSKNLIPLFSLGNLALCNTFIQSPEEEIRIPLELILCDIQSHGCGLVQLRHSTPPDLMYKKYWYQSGISSTMRSHLANLIHKAERIAHPQKGDMVLDIGCNDGTALRSYQTKNIQLCGFEPNQLYKKASVGTTKIVNDFFTLEIFRKAFGSKKAKIITSIAMFYDLEDPNKFVKDVKACLSKQGLWIIEMHYLPLMLQLNGFDAIVHEHLEYYSLTSLQNLLRRHQLELFDVELNGMNGGSFRIYIKHKGSSLKGDPEAEKRLRDLKKQEQQLRIMEQETYRKFWLRINYLKKQVRNFIIQESKKGKKIYVYGMSTKGNAVLQFFELDRRLIRAAADRNPEKWGKKTPVTHIPIISPEQAAREKPDYFLVLIWHLIEEVKEQWKEYIAGGGKLIVPLPKLTVLSHASGSAGKFTSD